MGDGQAGGRSATSFDLAQDERLSWFSCPLPFVLGEVEARCGEPEVGHG